MLRLFSERCRIRPLCDFCLKASALDILKSRYLLETIMEFLELVMLLAAVLLIWFKPEREKLAWGLAVGGWLMTVLIYVGHVSTGILGVLNL